MGDVLSYPRPASALAVLTALAAWTGCEAEAPSAAPERFDVAEVATPLPTTPIRHLVGLFQENVPFDRYFATYPHALNLPGEPRFAARMA